MAGLHWEKARRRELPVEPYQSNRKKRNKQRADAFKRQSTMRQFVAKHQIVCFICKEGTLPGEDWAKTGIAKHGPWCVHVKCVRVSTDKR